jgi:chemotaxis protein CheD
MNTMVLRPEPDATVSPDVTSVRQVIDIFLRPGELYFGDQDTRIRTVLGSCVAITLWNPLRRIGGMCHFMLPTRGTKHGQHLDGRYGDEAMHLLLKEIKRARSAPGEYEAKVFGGGNMFPGTRHHSMLHVGRRNIETGLRCLQHHKFRIKARHLAGHGHRNIVFDLWSGDVWVKHVAPSTTH